MIKRFLSKYLELIFWVAGLLALAITDPALKTHFSLCPVKMAGMSWCPGCGLGHSISWLFRGDIKNSFEAHWLGIPALVAICWRVYQLLTPRRRIFT
ncbi:DUF2752 domain-containing protein [Mucilaginibacter hurinus]|uniref:DUF2752 domain-containing protein n=1 Tax=Mucilaginibacter hurinus TaxID=2201324 RepID=A0A367GPC8_9SPHI|nr:DUF2752 domain-containing protein [Mucilaginibacter hurinus]